MGLGQSTEYILSVHHRKGPPPPPPQKKRKTKKEGGGGGGGGGGIARSVCEVYVSPQALLIVYMQIIEKLGFKTGFDVENVSSGATTFS